MKYPIRRIVSLAAYGCELIAALSLFAMMALTFVDVVGRYVFSFPIFGSVEIIGLLLAVCVFSGLCVAVWRDDHIAVELIPLVSGVMGQVLRYAILLFSVAALGLIFYVLAHEAISDAEKGARFMVLDMPRTYATIPMAILAGLALALQLVMLFIGGRVSPEDRA